jgi:site-specific recombinase XerD
MQFAWWLGLRWPDEAHELLRVTAEDVQAYRDFLLGEDAAPTTVDQRLSALCRFYEYLIRQAAKGRLPINVLNPAHPDFVPRENAEARSPTRALSLEQLHELLSLPSGDSLVALRDRAILNVGLAMGFRVSTLCRLEPTDFFEDPRDGPSVRYWQKGGKQETEGIHSKAFVAVRQYRDAARITSGALFRPRANRSSKKLADRPMSERGMSELLQGYLDRVPGGLEPRRNASGEEGIVSVFSPHSLRATTATILDGQRVPRARIQALLAHKKPETTDGYCRTEYTGRDSASHAMPL